MLTEPQIEYCLAKIRQQLTPVEGQTFRPNIEQIIGTIKRTIDEAYQDDKATSDSDSICELGLEERTSSILERAGYETVLALRNASAKELLEIKHVGIGMLEEVREAIAERGFRLRGDKPKGCFHG